MSVPSPQPDAPRPATSCFQLTPGHCLLALLAVEFLLFLSQWFRWLPKGWPVLIAVASVGVVILAMFVWFAVALVIRRRFKFSIRSLLVLMAVVAMPCSWLTVEMKRAEQQAEAVRGMKKAGGDAWYDYHVIYDDQHHMKFISPAVLIPGWVLLRRSLGDDFFDEVIAVDVEGDRFTDSDLRHVQKLTKLAYLSLNNENVTDVGLQYLEGLADLQELVICGPPQAGLKRLGTSPARPYRKYTKVTDAGVAKLQKALPNCRITR